LGKLRAFDKFLVSFDDKNLLIIDPLQNTIVLKEHFDKNILLSFPYLLSQAQGKRTAESFLILVELRDRIIIKKCELKNMTTAFLQYLEEKKIDESIKLFIKNETLWTTEHLTKIFEKRNYLKSPEILKDAKFTEIVDKVIEF